MSQNREGSLKVIRFGLVTGGKMPQLESLFDPKAPMGPIQYEGKTLWRVFEIPIEGGDVIALRIISAKDIGHDQAVSLDVNKGNLDDGKVEGRSFRYWASGWFEDNLPVQEIRFSGRKAKLAVWNEWGVGEESSAWVVGDAAMIVNKESDRYTFLCNWGGGRQRTFQDLVFELTVHRR